MKRQKSGGKFVVPVPQEEEIIENNRHQFGLFQQQLLNNGNSYCYSHSNNHPQNSQIETQYQDEGLCTENFEDDEFDEEAENRHIQAGLRQMQQLKAAYSDKGYGNGEMSPPIVTTTSLPSPAETFLSTQTYTLNQNGSETPRREMNSCLDLETFIEEVRKYPCLWNCHLPCYKDITQRKNAWKKILVEIKNPNITGKYFTFLSTMQCLKIFNLYIMFTNCLKNRILSPILL